MTCPDGRSGGRRFCVRCGLVCKIGVRLSSSSRTEYGRFNLTLAPDGWSRTIAWRFWRPLLWPLSYAGKNWRGAGVEPASQESPPVSSLSLDEPRCEATRDRTSLQPRMPCACIQASDDEPLPPCRWPLKRTDLILQVEPPGLEPGSASIRPATLLRRLGLAPKLLPATTLATAAAPSSCGVRPATLVGASYSRALRSRQGLAFCAADRLPRIRDRPFWPPGIMMPGRRAERGRHGCRLIRIGPARLFAFSPLPRRGGPGQVTGAG